MATRVTETERDGTGQSKRFRSTGWTTDKCRHRWTDRGVSHCLSSLRADVCIRSRWLVETHMHVLRVVPCETVRTIEIKLKRNWNKTVLKTVSNCFVSAKTKPPTAKRFSCRSKSLSVYAVCAPNQRQGGAMTYASRRCSQCWVVTRYCNVLLFGRSNYESNALHPAESNSFSN